MTIHVLDIDIPFIMAIFVLCTDDLESILLFLELMIDNIIFPYVVLKFIGTRSVFTKAIITCSFRTYNLYSLVREKEQLALIGIRSKVKVYLLK